MGKFRKKILAVLLAAACAAQLAACGQRAAETDHSQAETVNAPKAVEGAESQTGGGTAVSMGRYMETSIPLPEGADGMGRSMEVLSDGRLAYFDGDSGLWSSGDGGETWENIRKISDGMKAEGYVDTADIATDGSVGVCLITSENGEIKAKVGWMDPDGAVILADGKFGDGDWVTGVFFRNPEELYAVTLKGKVLLFNREEKALEQVFMAVDQPQVLAFSGKKLLALENDGVEIYDTELKALMDSDPVLNDFCRENISGKLNNTSGSVGGILLDGEEGVIYLAYDGGVFRHVLGGNALEQVIDGNFSTFGNPSMGICDMLLLPTGEFLLLTTGEDMIRFTYDPNEPTVPESQLKVYSLEENPGLRQAISTFQKQNPDVYVNYETGLSQNSAVTAADALKNLNVELMSGAGPDVILMDGIDVSVYADKGMLKDLSGLLDGLTGDDALIPNVSASGKTEKGTFVIPSAFQVLMICGKEEDISKVKDLKSLADLTERLRAQRTGGSITGCYTARQVIGQLMVMSEGIFLDGRRLNTEAVTEFLTQAKRIYEAEKQGISAYEREQFGSGSDVWSIGNKGDFLGTGQIGVAFGLADGMLDDIGAMQALEGKGYTFALLPSQKGTGFVPVGQLAVASNSTRAETAEAFLKTMLSCEVQSIGMSDGFPVNLKAFDRACEGTGMEDVSMGSSWDLEDGARADFSFRYPSREYTARFKEMALAVSHNLEGNRIVKEAVLKYGTLALEGKQEIEDAAADIQKAVSIYLAE